MNNQVKGLCPSIPKHATAKERHQIAIDILDAVDYFGNMAMRLIKDAELYDQEPWKYPFKTSFWYQHRLEIVNNCKMRLEARYQELMEGMSKTVKVW